jgi:hypothetical protein
MWQDIAAASMGLVLSLVVWPMVWKVWWTRNVTGHSMWTALPTALLLTGLGLVYYSAGLHLTGWAHAPPALAWYCISVFIWRFKIIPDGWMEERSW